MNCSICGNEMVEGEAALKSTLFGFVYFGLSYQNLYFKQKDTSKKNRELTVKDSKVMISYKCRSCDCVLITNRESDKNWIYF